MHCGPRTDQSDYVHQDNNCESARNGVCEDGGTGSSYYVDIDGGQAHLCGYGTDFDDCAAYGPRKIFSFGYLSYAGVTNSTYPLPPPPPPFPPPTPSPPLNISWHGCVTDPARVCYSFSKPDSTKSYSDFACSGTAEQLYFKVQRKICTAPTPTSGTLPDMSTMSYNGMLDLFLKDVELQQDCSDGGFGSVAIRFGKNAFQNAEPTFGCDYGSQARRHQPTAHRFLCMCRCLRFKILMFFAVRDVRSVEALHQDTTMSRHVWHRHDERHRK